MLDFLYADHERVASFLAQESGLGALINNEETASKTKVTGVEGRLSLGPVGGSATGERNWSKDVRLAYDPLWMNSTKLVELVSDKQSGQFRSQFDYGDLVTVTGRLLCMDQALIGNLMRSPAFIDQIASGLNIDDTNRSSKAKSKERHVLAETIRDFMNSLPLGVVFILLDEKNAFWFNVKREYLQLQSLDIPLKFPVQIGGLWHVTGVIDALPQDHAEIASVFGGYGDRLIVSQALTIIAQLVVPLVGLFGRPADAYGLSPVTIHRKIAL